MAFDIIGAKRAGYSDPEIADFLGQKYGINVSGAREAGYTDQAIIGKALSRYGAGTDAKESVTNATFGKPDAQAEQMRKQFVADTGTITQRAKEFVPSRKTLADMARPSLEMVGTVAGEALGAPFSPVTGGASIPALGGLGYAAGSGVANLIEGKPASLESIGQDISTGAKYVMAGNAAVPALSAIAKSTGAVAKPLLGKLSGVGPGAIDEAIKSGTVAATGNPLASKTAFDKALRGKISGEEIVDNARTALQSLKTQRATAYQNNLAIVDANKQPIDLIPIKTDLSNLLNRYKVKVNPQGGIDTSRVPMGSKGRKDIEEIVDTVNNWGSQAGDDTAVGLDTLKRQLDDFYSESSQARQFVTEIRNKVKDAIVKHVPEYDEMTKGYSEATKLIKDVEADLMLRKHGMSGRVTADKTLRRLTSAMRDNFEMRRELVNILGSKGGEDLSGQIAGYTMNTAIPRGLAGTGPVLAGQAAYAHFINPSFWPVLAASSPRVQGEFLRVFGKGAGIAKKIPAQAVKGAVMQGAIASEGRE